ncbi:hypothetical protein QBC46DRAFT_409280 [Diplogelasinospora grovesii]|uniref:Uncharacterized protein n=1 Tax=Diplogelasinospora grovesii TaxID=303347 RepID=A0AAN6S4C4_9PEZI|nr:hypothetical protein QBC46DRAFT_409280 [Diplogelasinospora grovesii]
MTTIMGFASGCLSNSCHEDDISSASAAYSSWCGMIDPTLTSVFATITSPPTPPGSSRSTLATSTSMGTVISTASATITSPPSTNTAATNSSEVSAALIGAGTSNSSGQTAGLSSGRIAGIAVGGVFGAAVLLLAGFYLGRRERNTGAGQPSRPTLPAVEADSRQKYELDNTSRPAHELRSPSSPQGVFELPNQPPAFA